MPYFMSQDFAGGLDLRKSAVTAKAGSLRAVNNAFITAGGEIEKRRLFNQMTVLPTGTLGLLGGSNVAYVFGLAAGVSVQAPFVYQQLTPSPALPGGVTLSKILDADVFGSSNYVIASFSDNVIRHFYNGAQVATAPSGYSTVRAHKNKLYGVGNGPNLRISGVNSTDWTATGSGVIDTTSYEAGFHNLIGLDVYYDKLALFGRRTVQLWAMNADPAQNQLIQTIANIGLVAPGATVRYGSGDVLFLSDTGFRSLRARDASNNAMLNDVGSPVDNYVRPLLDVTPDVVLARVQGLVDPLTGHVWFVWGNKVLVFASYLSTKVSAWSVYQAPGVIDAVAVVNNRILFRVGDAVFSYGSGVKIGANVPDSSATAGASDYDNSQVEVITPFWDFDQPATSKQYVGIDVSCVGQWHVEYRLDPNDESAPWTAIADVNNTTYFERRVPFMARATHVQLRLTSSSGFARLGAVGIHFQAADAS